MVTCKFTTYVLRNILVAVDSSLIRFLLKNNHHLDFMQGFISTSGVNTAFFHPKKWQNMLKIDFLGCHGNG